MLVAVQKGTSARILHAIGIYKEIQLLTITFNRLAKHGVVSVQILVGIACFCAALYGLISQFSVLDVTSGFILSCGMMWGSIMTLLVFDFPTTKVNVTSRATLRKCKITTVNMIRKGFKGKDRELKALMVRNWKSFPVIKIVFFLNKSFDRVTPGVLLNFSVKWAIKWSLIEEKE